jgi:hypothetical protein
MQLNGKFEKEKTAKDSQQLLWQQRHVLWLEWIV